MLRSTFPQISCPPSANVELSGLMFNGVIIEKAGAREVSVKEGPDWVCVIEDDMGKVT